jgi:hypothetical protein
MSLPIILLFVAACFAQNTDRVEKLPLFDGKFGPQYSGYIPINPSQDKFFHYYFVESQNNPATDPLGNIIDQSILKVAFDSV